LFEVLVSHGYMFSAPIAKDNIQSGDKMNLTGYRYSVTGAFGYHFYKDDTEVCSAEGLVIPSAPIIITTPFGEYISKFDMFTTIVPGLTRYVEVKGSGEEAWRIIYRDLESTHFEIICKHGVIMANIQDGEYLFFIAGKQVAVIRGLQGSGTVVVKNGLELEPFFDVDISDELAEEYWGPVVSFPQLRFAM